MADVAAKAGASADGRGLVAARARLVRPPGGAGFALHRMGRQREKRAVGEFKIAAENLHLALIAAPAFDHKLGANRKSARQPA